VCTGRSYHVNGEVVPLINNAINGIAAGIKDKIVQLGLGEESLDTRALGGGTRSCKGAPSIKLLGRLLIQIVHQNLRGGIQKTHIQASIAQEKVGMEGGRIEYEPRDFGQEPASAQSGHIHRYTNRGGRR